jgi:hypothetical protein
MECLLSALTVSIAILTLVWPQWIEATFGVDPDQGTGTAEWTIVTVCFLLAATSSLFAGRDLWRRRRATAPVPRS